MYLENLYFVFAHQKLVELLVDCRTDAGVSRVVMNATRYASRTFIAKSEKVYS